MFLFQYFFIFFIYNFYKYKFKYFYTHHTDIWSGISMQTLHTLFHAISTCHYLVPSEHNLSSREKILGGARAPSS